MTICFPAFPAYVRHIVTGFGDLDVDIFGGLLPTTPHANGRGNQFSQCMWGFRVGSQNPLPSKCELAGAVGKTQLPLARGLPFQPTGCFSITAGADGCPQVGESISVFLQQCEVRKEISISFPLLPPFAMNSRSWAGEGEQSLRGCNAVSMNRVWNGLW